VPEIEIRQARVGDEEALLSFLRAVYPRSGRKADERFWRWYFTQNPNHDSDDPAVLIALEGERIVGQAGLLPVELRTPSGTSRAAWLVDFITDPQYRRRGLGTRMTRAAMDRYPVCLAAGPNEQSRGVFERLGWVDAARLSRFRRVLFPGTGAKELARWRRLRRAIDLLAAPLRPRRRALRPREGYTVRAVDGFDQEFEALWEAAQRQWQLAVVRSPRYLGWQFRAQPSKRFEVIGVYADDTLVGYAVLYFRRGWSADSPPAKAAITDVCYRTDIAPDSPSELVKASLAQALDRGAGSLVTDVADPLMEKALEGLGFFKSSYETDVIASAEGELGRLIGSQSNWYLTRADADLSILEEPNC